MGRIRIRTHARRTLAALVAALCAAGIAASAAQAAAPFAWAAPVHSDSSPGTLGVTAVSCQSTTLCVAVDDAGNFLSSSAPASGTWSLPASIDTPATAPHLTAVSCPSAVQCFAVDTTGNAYSTATPASLTPWTSGDIEGTTQLNGVSCPTTTLCVAADNTGHVLVSTTPGTLSSGSWPALDIDGSTHITAVSCPTASLCAAVDSAGKIWISATPTVLASWQATTLTTTSALTALSCNASGLCVAVAADGSVHATGNAASATPTWSATLIDAAGLPLSAVSCTDAGLCVMVDHAGNALESDNPAAGPPVWTSTAIDTAPHPLTAVSCLSAGFCAATDSVGDTLAATLPAPVVATGTGTASTQTTATLGASVNPNDAALSDCHFDYGPTTAYGSSAVCSVVPSATGGSQSVAASLAGLSAATTYHFRIVASSGVATADGADASFTTPAPLKASPSLSGTPAVGNTLTCKPNVTTTASETVAYAWLRDTLPIPGAAAATYVVAAADETHHLSCQVTIAGDGASIAATSGFDAVPSQTLGKITETFVGTDKHGATSVSAPVTCSRQATGNCTITLLLTATQTVRHKVQKITVGSATTKLKPGTTRTLSVSLNATGRSLLKSRHTLAATLTVSGTVIGTLKATLQTDKLTFGTKTKTKSKRSSAKHATRRPR
jgi:hypothetical protein